MYRENQDVYLARRVAEICGQPYQVITVRRTAWRVFRTSRTHTVPDRRLRGYQPLRGSVEQRDGAADRAGAHGRHVWQRDHSRIGDVQGRRAFAGIFRPECSLKCRARWTPIGIIARQSDEPGGLSPAVGLSLWRADAGADAADPAFALFGQ